MRLTKKQFGYPVLSNITDDYSEDFKFQIRVDNNQRLDNLRFKITVFMANLELMELIKSRKAAFVLHIEDTKSSFRITKKFFELETSLEVKKSRIRSTLQSYVFITSIVEINSFSSSSMNYFFKNEKFDFSPYQILAYSNLNKVEVTKELDFLEKPKSIFEVIEDKKEKNNIIGYQIIENRIVIKLPTKEFNKYAELNKYNMLRNTSEYIVLSNIIMPIMVELLYTLKNSYSLYEDKIWFKSLKKSFIECNVNLIEEFEKENFNAYRCSQIIFNKIILNSLNQTIKLLGSEV